MLHLPLVDQKPTSIDWDSHAIQVLVGSAEKYGIGNVSVITRPLSWTRVLVLVLVCMRFPVSSDSLVDISDGKNPGAGCIRRNTLRERRLELTNGVNSDFDFVVC